MVKDHHDFIETGYICDAKLPNVLFDVLSNAALSATRALLIHHGPCHVDVKLTADGPYVIEVNPRIAGSVISNLVADVYGFDLVKTLLQKCFDQDLTSGSVSPVVCSSAVLFLHDWDLKENSLPEDFEISGHTHTFQFQRQVVPSRCRTGMLSGKTRGIDSVWGLLHSVRDLLIENACKKNREIRELIWNHFKY